MLKIRNRPGLVPRVSLSDSLIVKSFDFAAMTELPPELTNTRSGAAWYQDDSGYLLHEASSNAIRFGTIYGSGRGALVEIAATAYNLYTRPSTGVVGSHFSAGDSIASIVTDADNPCKDLSSGTQVWQLDNTGGGGDVDVIFTGTVASAVSAAAYLKTITGDDAVLSVTGGGVDIIGHTVAGYSLHKVDGIGSATNDVRITVPAGSKVYVTCVNLQSNLGMTSFIDTSGSAVTRNADDLNGTADFWLTVAEGTFLYDFTIYDRGGKTAHYFEARDGGPAERFTLWHSGGLSYMSHETANSGTNYTGTATVNEQRIISAVSYADQNLIGSRNGFNFYTDNIRNAPDVSQFDESAAPLSFNSLNRGGAAPISGVVHRFLLLNVTRTADELDALTSPNLPNEVHVLNEGDSNFERWEGSNGGRPNLRYIANITDGIPDKKVVVTNEGKSGSCATYAASQLLGADWWSDEDDDDGGNIFYEALARNVLLTLNATKKFDYCAFSLGANDARSIANGDVTLAEFKTACQNILDQTIIQYGDVKFIMQNLLNSNHVDYTDTVIQGIRDIHRELIAEYNFIGDYDTYDVTLVDSVHPNEDGANKHVDRLSNIILAAEGRAALAAPPEVVSVEHNGDQVVITCNQANMSGSDVTPFAVFDDGTRATVSSLSINSNVITLEMASTIASGSVVELIIGYGEINGVVEANIVSDITNGYPLKTTSAIAVTENL